MSGYNDDEPDLQTLFREYPTIAICAPRETLIAALSAATTVEHARSIVDALDMYLEDGDGRAPVPFEIRKSVDPNIEIEKLKKERDEAIARAEKAEKSLRPPKPTARRAKGKRP
jgi:hypothetical protein